MATLHAVGHLVRRGVETAQNHFGQPADAAYIAQLQHDAELYDQPGAPNSLKPQELLPVVVTAFITLLIIASIRYTIGEVMASLAMIESPSGIAIVEPREPAPPKYTDEDVAPPAYGDEADAPLEKEALMRDEDVEVTLIKQKPVTAKITTTIGLLHRVGGFRARWRGLGFSVLYHALHGMTSNFLAGVFGFGLVGHVLSYVFVSIGLARVHMAWTHAMIAAPSSKRFWQRIIPRKQAKAILLPSLVYALAQQATFVLPIAVAFALGLPDIKHEQIRGAMAMNPEDCHKMGLMALKFIAVPATALLVAIAVLLPAAVTLTRIEALLLPEDEETIVPFDKAALLRDGEIDLAVRGGCRKVFVQAWRSFDRAARGCIIKLYAKMILAQFTVAVIGLHLAVAELYLIGGERIALLIKSGAAQLRLMAIEAQQGQ